MSDFGRLEVILRVLGCVLSFVAAILVGVGKETKVVPIILSPNLPPFDVLVVAKWHYLSAFVYLFTTNVITSLYGLFSLIITLKNKNWSNKLSLTIIVFDTVMVALLSSGSGAAMAIGVIGYKGNSHVRWNKVCNTFDRFCIQVAASSVLSLAGALVFMLLVSSVSVGLNKRPK